MSAFPPLSTGKQANREEDSKFELQQFQRHQFWDTARVPVDRYHPRSSTLSITLGTGDLILSWKHTIYPVLRSRQS